MTRSPLFVAFLITFAATGCRRAETNRIASSIHKVASNGEALVEAKSPEVARIATTYGYSDLPNRVWTCDRPVTVLKTAKNSATIYRWAKGNPFEPVVFRINQPGANGTDFIMACYDPLSGPIGFNVHIFEKQGQKEW